MRKWLLNNRGVWQYAPTLIIFLFLISCTQKIAEVGEISITDKDISFRAKVSEVYYPNSGKGYVALSQLINGYLSEEILNSLGHKVDDEVLEKEAKRIDENTKAPETLKKIKDIYGRNRAAYIKTFIRIVYAERVLYNEVFLKSKEIHKEEHQKAEEILNKAIKSPKLFNDMAKEKELKAVRIKISKKDGIMPYENKKAAIKPHTPAGIEQAERLINTISKIKQGNIYPEIIEWLEGYQVIRYIKKERKESISPSPSDNPPTSPFSKGGQRGIIKKWKGGLSGEEDVYIIDSISIPKKNYDDWFYEKAAKIPVRVYDKGLKDELLKEVSWGKRVRLE